MRNGIKKIVPVIVLLSLASALFAQHSGSDQFRTRYQRLDALGGPHPAFIDDLSVLQTNPAGLLDTHPGYQFSTLNTTLTGPMLTLVSLVAAGGGEDALADEEVQNLLRTITATGDITGPVGLGYTGGGIGFTIQNNSGVDLTSPTAGTLELALSERVMLNGGYSFRFPLPRMRGTYLDMGLGIGTFIGGQSSDRFPLIELLDVVNSLSPSFVNDLPFSLESGFGFNLGMLLTHEERFSLALTADNLYAPTLVTDYDSLDAFRNSEPPIDTSTENLPVEINTGMRYRVRLGRLANLIDQVDVYASYFDAFDFLTRDNPRNPLLKFALGTEVQVLDILSLRGGFSEGLLAAGAGVELGVVHLNGAVYGRELSSEPGLNSVYNVGFSVDVRR
ncbi:MAG: hypothetical protein ACOC0B_00115 [bacterium]